MEISLSLGLTQEKLLPNGKPRAEKDLFKERLFEVRKEGLKSSLYNHENKKVREFDKILTNQIFRTNRKHYPAIYDYDNQVVTIVKSISLHGHSAYSLLDSISSIEDIAKKSEIAIAVTDHGNMFGALKFYQTMKRVGKQPILGMEAYTSSLPYTTTTPPQSTLRSLSREHKVPIQKLLEDNPTLEFSYEFMLEEGVDLIDLLTLKAEEVEVKPNQELYIEKSNRKNHLVLLAETTKGYQNLAKLSSIGYEKYTAGRPQIDWDDIRKYSEGIVALSACLAGELPRAILQNNMKQARTIIEESIDIFGKNNYFLEIQRHGIEEEKILNPALFELAEEYGLKVVATNDNHFTNEEDKVAHEAHLCIGTKTELSDPNRWVFPGEGYHIHTSSEMEKRFYDVPEVLDNTLDLAERLKAEIPTDELHMPEFPVPKKQMNQADYFEKLAWIGFEDRFKNTDAFNNKEYRERLQFEIDTINRMKFPGYFLIVADFVNYAKRNYRLYDKDTQNRWKKFIKSNGFKTDPMAVGPGRGSACGSLVAYCLHITNVDPIPYGLLFERFLNPDRISMPDIDLDFPDTRREEVLEYVRHFYGFESVSGIITFGTMAAKSVVRDVARVMGYPPSFGDKIAKLIPDKIGHNGKNLPINLKNAVEYDFAFSQAYNNEPDIKKVVDLAMRLEGLPRNASQHACGYVITPTAISNYIPQATVLDKTKKRVTVTQFTMNECEEVGLLKMDFLGLRTMGVIDNVIEQANVGRKNNNKELLTMDNLSDIAISDIHVYDFIRQGNTAGVFQLESAGMTDLMKQLFQDVQKLKESKNSVSKELFERLVAGISLYRPGPMDEIPNYIENMLEPNSITYDSQQLKDILSATYNVIVYQEQVMFIVRELAGFTRGQSDTIRKAMGKKKKEIIAEYEDYFLYGSDELGIEGCKRRGIPLDLAKDIWSRMEKFAEYAFNKSHAVGYANIAVMSAYLSYHYPVETMCAILNSYKTNADRIKQFISVCKQRDIAVLAPDVNESLTLFSVEKGEIRFGFNGLKNMGKSGQLIIEERNERGKFRDLFDFVDRMTTYKRLDRKMMEALIYSGSLDSFIGTRKEKLDMLDMLLGISSTSKENRKEGVLTLFHAVGFEKTKSLFIQPKNLGEMDFHDRLMKEKEFTGFYVTGHPLDQYGSVLKQLGRSKMNKISNFLSTDEDVALAEGEEIVYKEESIHTELVGVVQEVNIFFTKKGDQMASFEIEDDTGVIRAVVFPSQFANYSDLLEEGNVLAFEGKVETNDFGTQFITSSILLVEELAANTEPQSIQLILSPNRNKAKVELEEIEKILQRSQVINNIPLIFQIDNQRYSKRKGRVVQGNTSIQTISRLQHLLGMDNVQVVY